MYKTNSYCGLDCSKCDAYIATITSDNKLREETAKKWSELNNTTILPEQINCHGCKSKGSKTIFCSNICSIRKCAIKNKVNVCGECNNFSNCNAIKDFLKNNPSVIFNLKK